MKGLLTALGFLTVFPTSPQPPGGLGRSAVWFPVVGLAIGAVLAAAHLALDRFFPPLVMAAFLVTLWAFLTGGLHLEGVADSLDGLLAPAPPARRLEIMRDPRTGAFGAAGLALFLVLKVAALESLRPAQLLVLLLAPVMARWLVLVVAMQPCARTEGLAVELSRAVTWSTVILASAVPLGLVAFDLAGGRLRALFSLGASLLPPLAIGLLARARLGGVTGDILGLTVEAIELSVLLVYSVELSA